MYILTALLENIFSQMLYSTINKDNQEKNNQRKM